MRHLVALGDPLSLNRIRVVAIDFDYLPARGRYFYNDMRELIEEWLIRKGYRPRELLAWTSRPDDWELPHIH